MASPQDKTPDRLSRQWREPSAPCVGCNGAATQGSRTCGKRECIAVALCLSGLLPEPTVEALNEWYKASLIRQMVDYKDAKAAPYLLNKLVRQYALLTR